MGLARDQRDYNRTVLVITYVYTMLLLNIPNMLYYTLLFIIY